MVCDAAHKDVRNTVRIPDRRGNARAERRYKELLEKGEKGDLRQIEEDIIRRDEQDKNRTLAPLKKADDAVLIDSSNMSRFRQAFRRAARRLD